MKFFLFSFLILLLFILLNGCATVKKVPSFKDSNAYFLKNNLENIDMSELTKYLDKKDNIILVSIENEDTYDNSLISLIEDVLIKKLIDNGYNVLERDNDLLYRLMSESESSYTHYLRNKRRKYLNSRSLGSSSVLVGDQFYLHGASKSLLASGTNLYETENFDESKIQTILKAADKILAYRILEFGIVYEDITNKSIHSDSLNRVANAILNFRVDDANSGKILSINTIENSTTDQISKEHKKLLEDFHYRHYSFGYPNIYGNPEQIEYDKSKNKSSSSNTLYLLGTIGGAIILVISIGL